jgi:hypothetical protein
MMKRLNGEGRKPTTSGEQRGLTEDVRALLLERAKELSRAITERVRHVMERDRHDPSEEDRRS